MKATVKEGDRTEDAPAGEASREDLVGRPAVEGGVGTALVVEDEEVGADAQEVSAAREEPVVLAKGLAKGSPEALDAAVGRSCRMHPMRTLRTDASGSPTRSTLWSDASSTL